VLNNDNISLRTVCGSGQLKHKIVFFLELYVLSLSHTNTVGHTVSHTVYSVIHGLSGTSTGLF